MLNVIKVLCTRAALSGAVQGNFAEFLFQALRLIGARRRAEAANRSPGPARVANSVGLLLLFGNEPKLLHKAQLIVAIPLFDYLATLNAV